MLDFERYNPSFFTFFQASRVLVLQDMNHQESIATWINIVFVGFLLDVKMKLVSMMEKMEFAWVNTSTEC